MLENFLGVKLPCVESEKGIGKIQTFYAEKSPNFEELGVILVAEAGFEPTISGLRECIIIHPG